MPQTIVNVEDFGPEGVFHTTAQDPDIHEMITPV
jgi:hypothetical protein